MVSILFNVGLKEVKKSTGSGCNVYNSLQRLFGYGYKL